MRREGAEDKGVLERGLQAKVLYSQGWNHSAKQAFTFFWLIIFEYFNLSLLDVVLTINE